MSPLDSAIATLNNLGVGSLEKIEADLKAVRAELERLRLGELVEKLDACHRALTRGELQEFRKLRETIVSRLGHLRVKSE
jgi:hypothetical protein